MILIAVENADFVDVTARVIFVAAVILVPLLGYWLAILDIRAYLRALRGALVRVTNLIHTRNELPEWVKKESPPSILALGLEWPCSEEEIKKAYRKLAEKNHPDLGGNRQRFLYLQQHFENALQFARKHEKGSRT